VEEHLKGYRFAEAAEVVYHVVWDDVADWYVEVAKTEQHASMNAYVLDTLLRIVHPFAPFVTETIWQTLSWHDDILAGSSWPEKKVFNDLATAEFERLMALVSEARYVMNELPGNQKYPIIYQNDALVADNSALIQKLTRAASVEYTDTPTGLRLAASGREAWLAIDQETLYQHQSNLERRLAETRQELQNLDARLANENYVKKAPAALVEETTKLQADKKLLIERLEAELSVIDSSL
jgi:valyl-tRNA synthetase